MGNSSRMSECHPDKKHKAFGLCTACYKKHLRKTRPEVAKNEKLARRRWEANNRDRVNAASRRYYAANKEKYRQYRERRNQKPDAEKLRKHAQLNNNYSLSLDQYNALLEAQGHKCAICEQPLTKPNVDHCHTTGKVRGVLCTICNTLVLGVLENYAGLIPKALSYLAANGKSISL